MTLRMAIAADYDRLGQVMFHAIRDGESPYTDAQRVAWMPEPNGGPDWAARLSQHHIVVAERDQTIVGFLTVDADGYIDLAYILPEARGCGLFSQLLGQICDFARANSLSKLRTHASLMAQPAFAQHGFEIVQHEVVERAGEHLKRAEMCKIL